MTTFKNYYLVMVEEYLGEKVVEKEDIRKCKQLYIKGWHPFRTAQRMKYDRWLPTVCFQEPTPEAYDLAWEAWEASIGIKL